MVNTITLKELRPELPQVINGIDSKLDRYIVTKRGKPVVVMMSVDDYESLMETIAIQSDTDLMKSIQKAKKEVQKGKGKNLNDLNKELGLV